MRKGWEVKKLGDVTEVINGGTPKTKVKEYWNGCINWITPKDLGKLKDIYVSETPRKITELGLKKSSAKLFKRQSVIISTRAPIGHLAINLVSMSTNQGCRGIVPHKNLSTKYLYYFLSKSIKLLNYLGTGTTFKELSTKSLKSVDIPIPPLEEQEQIVAILDNAFEAIDQAKENIERNIENANELFQSKLNEIFSQKGEGWEEKKFKEICKYDKTKFKEDDRPYIGLEDLESGSGNFLGDLTIRNVKSSTFEFDSRHVLYGRLRPYLNKVFVPNFKGHCSTEIFPILTSKEIERQFLFYWFLTPKTVNRINLTWTGARMPRANMNEVLNFKLNIPDLKTQKEIVLILNNQKASLNNVKTAYHQKLNNLEELKKSILEKAFSGELTETIQV